MPARPHRSPAAPAARPCPAIGTPVLPGRSTATLQRRRWGALADCYDTLADLHQELAESPELSPEERREQRTLAFDAEQQRQRWAARDASR
jgi:hypothetical protein